MFLGVEEDGKRGTYREVLGIKGLVKRMSGEVKGREN